MKPHIYYRFALTILYDCKIFLFSVAETQLVPKGFRECGAEDILVSQAVVPAAFLELTLPASETENVESVYKLNESIVTALMQTLEQAFNLTEKRIESNGM